MKKKIFVRGPVLSQSGYGEQARFALRALKTREDLFDIYIQAIPWGRTGWVWEQSEFREWMDERITETQVKLKQKALQPDISLQITIPNEFEKMCPINIGYTAGIETDKVAPVWLQKCNMMDKVLVVSNHAKNTLTNTVAEATNNQTGETFPYKLQTETHVVHESTPSPEIEPIEELNLDFDFNYLMVSQISARKNFENSLKWWVEEFIDQEVGLILKTNIKCNSIMDWEYLQKNVSALLSKYENRKCKVYLLHGDLTAGQMRWLYSHDKIKCLVNLAHGEGFGLPMFEAAREALPILTVGWSGQLDFLRHDGKDYFLNVDHKVDNIQPEAVWDGVLQSNSKWAYADQGDYKMKLRNARKNWKQHKNTATELQALVLNKFNDDELYANFVSHLVDEPEMVDWMNWSEDQQEAQDF